MFCIFQLADDEGYGDDSIVAVNMDRVDYIGRTKDDDVCEIFLGDPSTTLTVKGSFSRVLEIIRDTKLGGEM